MQREIPDGYEVIEHHDHLGLHNAEAGVVITTHERDRIRTELHDEYPFVVRAAQEQETLYTGSFPSETHAEDKVVELAETHG